MSLSPELLEILACPKCKGKIRLRREKDNAAILCDACRLAYPIRDEIPVMLIDEAESFSGE
ncbi:MAG: Trm112 family protein [Desulfuromonadales bacterium]